MRQGLNLVLLMTRFPFNPSTQSTGAIDAQTKDVNPRTEVRMNFIGRSHAAF